MYFKNYTLANIPTKLMYKHRVDYYDYTLQYFILYICMKQAYISKQFRASEIAHRERGSRVGKRTLGEVNSCMGNARWGNMNVGRGVNTSGNAYRDRSKMNVGKGFTRRDQRVPRTVSFSATIEAK